MVWPVYIVQKEIQKEFDLCPYMSCTYLQKASVNLNLLLLSIAIWQIEIKFPRMLFLKMPPSCNRLQNILCHIYSRHFTAMLPSQNRKMVIVCKLSILWARYNGQLPVKWKLWISPRKGEKFLHESCNHYVLCKRQPSLTSIAVF